MTANLKKNFDAIKIKEDEEKIKEDSKINSRNDQTINLKSLRKEFCEIKTIMKKTKHYITNNNKNEQTNITLLNNNQTFNKEKNERFINNNKNNINNNIKRSVVSGTNILFMNLDMKKNSQENEIKNAQAKNYLEVPIDINLNHLQQHGDKNLSLQQNKENFNTINLNEILEEQSISSFISTQ